ncbi:MAP kinase-activated protein kinase 2-like protein [Oopsacas minuta]|uniref:MAP kinase-activated protein kinase 2-like protein n=1 Tax=Oopsacas minuta TaxID=111878 RepID=A0AAV7JFR9_9METZ|nr:MAP kinase-activated protein kinase 2-like protein [Oopsacas minuta]
MVSRSSGKDNTNIFRWSLGPKPRSPLELNIHKEQVEKYYDIHWNNIVGEGVSGAVCECESIETGKKFVLKVLAKNEYSFREIQLHYISSNSKNVVQIEAVYECFMRASCVPDSSKILCYAIVMEYMEGGDLYDFISTKGSFTEKEAAHIILQICEALFHLHSLNIAHRDLKPENSLTNIRATKINHENTIKDLIIKITDFGYAKEDDQQMKSPLYTPYYVPPEVIVNDAFWPGAYVHFYDKSCDMWSLGVIIYIILCGYPPFYPEMENREITSEMVEKIKFGCYTFPEHDWKDISMDAKDLIRKLLVVEPNKRLTSVEVITHPWLNKKLPNTPLSTPKNAARMKSLYTIQTFSDMREEMRARSKTTKETVGTKLSLNSIDPDIMYKRRETS